MVSLIDVSLRAAGINETAANVWEQAHNRKLPGVPANIPTADISAYMIRNNKNNVTPPVTVFSIGSTPASEPVSGASEQRSLAPSDNPLPPVRTQNWSVQNWWDK